MTGIPNRPNQFKSVHGVRLLLVQIFFTHDDNDNDDNDKN